MTGTDITVSRRDFLAGTTLGIAGLWSGASASLVGTLAKRGGMLLYVGTYTEGGRRDGIHFVRMNSRTGALHAAGEADVGPNPSFLSIHPGGRTLYAVNEITALNGRPTGTVRAFTIAGGTGRLTPLGATQPTEGAAPCYLSTDRAGHNLLVANYVSGTIAMLPIGTDGALGAPITVVQHEGRGPTARQESPHAHCIVAHPAGRFVLAADLGIDRVLVYQLEAKAGTLRPLPAGDAVLPPGTGPRHLAFHPTLPLVFVSGELASTVTALRVDAETGALAIAETRSTLPDGWNGENFPADIHVAPSGHTLYVSNRGHNSIAVFSVAESTGALALEQVVSTGGDWPRNFTIDPTNRWLLVANQRSNSITVFARDLRSGRLAPTSQRLTLPSPACLRFHDLRAMQG